MTEYEFEKVTNRNLSASEENHRKVIQQRAENGWRYVGCVPLNSSTAENEFVVDFVFEKNHLWE